LETIVNSISSIFHLADVLQYGRMALEMIMKSVLYGDAQGATLPEYSGNFLHGL